MTSAHDAYLIRRQQERRRIVLRANRNVGTCGNCGHLVEIVEGLVDRRHRIDGVACKGSGAPPRGVLIEEGDH